MTKRFFPKNNGIAFVAMVEIVEDHVAIQDFVFQLNGTNHQINSGEFDLIVGDTVYITPQGLQKVSEKEYPTSLFDTNSAYWLVSKIKDDMLVLEVEQ